MICCFTVINKTGIKNVNQEKIRFIQENILGGLDESFESYEDFRESLNDLEDNLDWDISGGELNITTDDYKSYYEMYIQE